MKFTTPWRSSFVIDVAYARLRDDDRFDPRPEVSNGAISRFDSVTNTFTEAWPTYNFNLHKRDQAHASFSYFAGTHDIRAGYSIFVNGKPSAIWSTSAMRADYASGVPDLGSHLQRRRSTTVARPTTSSRCSRRATASRAITSRTSGRRRASW